MENLSKSFLNYLEEQGFTKEEIQEAEKQIPDRVKGLTREVAIRDLLRGEKNHWWND